MVLNGAHHQDPLCKCTRDGCELSEFFNRQSKIGVNYDVHDVLCSNGSDSLSNSGVSQ